MVNNHLKLIVLNSSLNVYQHTWFSLPLWSTQFTFSYLFNHHLLPLKGAGQYEQLWNLTGLVDILPLVKMELKCHLSSSDFFHPPLPSFRLCWYCPVYQPSLSWSPSWWFSPSSYTTAAVTVVTGARDRRRRRRMKMAAQVTVTTGRRGGASAVSRGWRWQLSRCAGEEEDSDVIITYRTLKFFWQGTQVIF